MYITANTPLDLLLSPISKLPCILQQAKVVTTQWNALLRKELT